MTKCLSNNTRVWLQTMSSSSSSMISTISSSSSSLSSSSSSSSSSPPPPPSSSAQRFTLFLDFDGTLTKEDSTPYLASMVIKSLPNSETKVRGQLSRSWIAFEQRFLNNYAIEFQSAFSKAKQELISSSASPSFHHFFEHMNHFDNSSVLETSRLRMLKGIEWRVLEEDVRKNGREKFRSGAIEFLQRVNYDTTLNLHVVSVNWSSRFLRLMLQTAINPLPSKLHVHSNELALDESDCFTTGEVTGELHGALDKSKLIRKLKASYPFPTTSIYIGDGLNDLLALIEVDCGIWLDSNRCFTSNETSKSSIQKVCELFKIELQSLNMSKLTRANSLEKRIIWVASSWQEIIDWWEDKVK